MRIIPGKTPDSIKTEEYEGHFEVAKVIGKRKLTFLVILFDK